MGKRSKERYADEQNVIKIENEMEKITKTKSTNELSKSYLKAKIMKKSKKKLLSGNDVIKEISTKSKKKIKHEDEIFNNSVTSHNIPDVDTNDNCKKNKKKKLSEVRSEPNDQELPQEINLDHHKKVRKGKLNKVAELVPSEVKDSNESTVRKSTKNRKKVTPLSKVKNDDELSQETLKNCSKGSKKKMQNVMDEEVQQSDKNNVSNEKPKKKKKRKIVKEEIVDDEEIDRYCNELDDFHNKQYENWVKLIEENLNKNVKK